ncbi:hypothetical protein [Pedobacter gandavensis]|uniref:hypothetical protein n=1 Tax=Pedobacter gandavensis TaxID=2679963 RepID=UPI0029317561|nr:hypothetical protein [Pedobacter gandavensis]
MFQIYLEDKTNNQYTELDVEDIDFTTVYSVADIKDISSKTDTITKNLKFKGTTRNNHAFGYAFHLNKNIDELNTNLLFYNYNPQNLVDCKVYEDSVLITRGSLRLIQTTTDVNGNITYDCIITGDVIQFNSLIGDLKLTDLDLSDMKHLYNSINIYNTWDAVKGERYVYPIINYGTNFKSNYDVNAYNYVYNRRDFKPAMYVNEIFKRIFSNVGFKYEIKGDDVFKDSFKKLILLNNDEEAVTKIENFYNFSMTSGQPYGDGTLKDTNAKNETIYLKYNGYDSSSYFTANSEWTRNHCDNSLFNVTTNFKFDGNAHVDFNLNYAPTFPPLANGTKCIISLQLVKRGYTKNVTGNSDNNNSFYYNTSFAVIAQTSREYISPLTFNNIKFDLEFKDVELKETEQFALRISIDNVSIANASNYFNINSSSLNMTRGTVEYKFGDEITPTLPAETKQLDFLNSIRKLFNFYVYADKDDQKKIIFEKYDDYYSLTDISELKSNAIDWTKKINHSSSFTVKSNIDIPKNYNFKFKTDGDFLNDNYKKKYNIGFGDYNLTDSSGITEKKDVEVLFSATPTVRISNFPVDIPMIYKLNGASIEPVKNNLRLLYYNGKVPTKKYWVGYDIYNSGNNSYSFGINETKTEAGVAYSYLLDSDLKVVGDLHFYKPYEKYDEISESSNVKYSYDNYINQITELTNPNVIYVECKAYLTPNDINNLDLKIPVFIDTGTNGYAYFKVLEVSYTSSDSPTNLKLQKIAI